LRWLTERVRDLTDLPRDAPRSQIRTQQLINTILGNTEGTD
jgi:hypothetical protein